MIYSWPPSNDDLRKLFGHYMGPLHVGDLVKTQTMSRTGIYVVLGRNGDFVQICDFTTFDLFTLHISLLSHFDSMTVVLRSRMTYLLDAIDSAIFSCEKKHWSVQKRDSKIKDCFKIVDKELNPHFRSMISFLRSNMHDIKTASQIAREQIR